MKRAVPPAVAPAITPVDTPCPDEVNGATEGEEVAEVWVEGVDGGVEEVEGDSVVVML